MKQDRDHSPEAADLRRRAEARLREQETQAGRQPPTAEEAQRLIHELRVHQIELELQNEELRESRDRLEENLERYTDLYDFAPVGYFTLTHDGTILGLNFAGSALLGQVRFRLIGRRFGLFVTEEDRPGFNAMLDLTLAGTSRECCDVALDRAGKPPCHVHLEGVRIDSGVERACRLAAIDITERKHAEEELRGLLEDKELLLREAHHRIKNNLATVIALLELQRESVPDASSSARLTESGHRIKAMALVHEMLYQPGRNLGRIDFHDYLQALVAYLRDSLDPDGAVRLEVTTPEIEMNLDTAIPCGLIVNELVTNAFNHAFPEPRSRPGSGAREIAVAAGWDGGTAYTLTVADNGVGLPADLDWTTSRTLGMRLVRMLGEHQLCGKIELDGTRGTRFSLRFGARRGQGTSRHETKDERDGTSRSG